VSKSHVLFGSFFGRSSFLWLIVGLAAGLTLAVTLFASPQARADQHGNASIVVTPAEAHFAEDTEVMIYGANLVPGTQVTILLMDGNGVYSDISSMSSPFPLVVNEDGAFAAKWVLDRWPRPGVGGKGVFSVRVMDEEFNEIGAAPISFCDHERDEDADVPSHCSR
jgi:hypothetical protein